MRVDSDETLEQVRKLFNGSVVDDASVASDYSIDLGVGSADDPAMRIPTLWHGGRRILRTRSVERCLAGLLGYVGCWADGYAPTTAIEMMSVAVVLGDSAVVVPRDLVTESTPVERSLQDAGATVSDGPTVFVSRSGPTLVVPDPAGFLGGRLGDRPALSASAGQYDLVGIALGTRSYEPDVSSAARSVAALVSQVLNSEAFGGQELLETMADIIVAVRPYVLDMDESMSAVQGVLETLQAGN